MPFRMIHAEFWTDPKIRNLGFKEKYLLLYFITNLHSHLSGLYFLSEGNMLEETGLPINDLKKAIYELHNKELIRYNPGYSVIWVVNMLRYQTKFPSMSPKLIKGIENYLRNLHNCPLIYDFLEYYPDLHVSFVPRGKDLAIEEDVEEGDPGEAVDEKIERNAIITSQIKEIFEFWQTTMNTPGAKFTRGRKIKIGARLRAGYTMDQIKKAIVNCSKSPFYMGENDRQQIYNDITLICRNDEKLEGFIGLSKDISTARAGRPARFRDEKDGTVWEWSNQGQSWEPIGKEGEEE